MLWWFLVVVLVQVLSKCVKYGEELRDLWKWRESKEGIKRKLQVGSIIFLLFVTHRRNNWIALKSCFYGSYQT